MFVLVENNSITKTVNNSKGITIGENQYPRAIFTSWSAAEREAIGIYEVVLNSTNFKDTQYYTNTNPSITFADGIAASSYGSAVAKQLEDITEVDENGDTVSTKGLKSQKKILIKDQARSLLASTDWHVIKAIEVESYSVSAEQTDYRAAVRTTSNDMEALIDACTSVDELAALYAYTEQEDGTHTKPLGEFPEAV